MRAGSPWVTPGALPFSYRMDRDKVRKVQRYFNGALHRIELTWEQAKWVTREMEAGRDLHLVADELGHQTILGLPDPET